LIVGDTIFQLPAFYSGYRASVWDNVAKSHNSGAELNYSQPLTFLPGPLSGLSFFFNETHLIYDSWDNYLNSSKDIGNAGLSYKYKKYGGSFSVNRTGYHRDSTPAAAGSANAGIANYTRQRTMCDMSLSYALTRNLSIVASGRNIFNEPATTYSLGSEIITRQARFGALWTVGISGKY
jgi:outer membrane receptor protein involved in Fe transport